MANPPPKKAGSDKVFHSWKCPNHIDGDLALIRGLGGLGRNGRIRRPRNPKFIDIDVVPSASQEEGFVEREMQGTVYRVSERGLMLDFIARVKQYVLLLSSLICDISSFADLCI
jgi:hypothetical protein